MLEHFRHRHFAKKLFRPWGESRFLWFANKNDNDQDGAIGPEGQNEQPEEFEPTPLPEEKAVENITNINRVRMEGIGALLSRAAVASPFTLRTALEQLTEQKSKKVQLGPEIEAMMTQAQAYLDALATDTKPTLKQKKALEQKVEKLLDNPILAHIVTKAFDLRSERYKELMKVLGRAKLSDIVELEQRLKLRGVPAIETFVTDTTQDNTTNLITVDMLSDVEVEEIMNKLQIDDSPAAETDTSGLTREEKEAHERALERVKRPEGPLTKEEKVLRIEDKIMAARRIAVMEQMDFDSQTTLAEMDILQETIVKQTVHARRHLERVIKLRASELKEQWNVYCKALENAAGSNKREDIAAHLGVDLKALDHRYTEIEAALHQAQRTGKWSIDGEDRDDPKNMPRISDEQFTRKAQTILERLDDLSWLQLNDASEQTKKFTEDMTIEREHSEAWLTRNAKKMTSASQIIKDDPDALKDAVALLSPQMNTGDEDTYSNAITLAVGIAQRASEGNTTDQDMAIIHEHFPKNKRQWWEQLLLVLSSPSYKRKLQRDIAHIERDTILNTPANAKKTLADFQKIENQIFLNGAGSEFEHPTLKQHHVCTALPIHEELSNWFTNTEKTLRSLEHMEGTKADSMLRECRLFIDKCTRMVQELNALESPNRIKMIPSSDIALYKEKSGGSETSVGCYNYKDNTIYLNEQALQYAERQFANKSFDDLKEEAILHEKGHAILNILMHRTNVVPNLFVAFDKKMADKLEDSDNAIFEDVLRRREEDWGIHLQRKEILEREKNTVRHRHPGISDEETERLAMRATDALVHEMMIDELANKYASWKYQKEKPDGFTEEDIALFNALKGDPERLKNVAFNKKEIASYDLPEYEDWKFQSELQFGGEGAAEEEEEEGPPKNEGLIGDRVSNAQNKLMMIKEFIENHENVDGVEEFKGWVLLWEEAFNKYIRDPFYGEGPLKDTSEVEIDRMLSEMDAKFFDSADKQMADVTQAEMNNSSASGQRGLLDWIKSHELASINDVIGMFKSMGEDLQRMWKRRAERVQSLMGYNLTSWFPDNNLIALRYAGQLKHEFERRQSASEVEEVKQWKDALSDLDSYALMIQMASSRNKDEVRAIAEILTERGRLDMNDIGMWKTLKALSGLPMPIDACRDNSVLRDRWLQRMITAIWDDKDKFFDWRQSNDSGIDSGKKKFTQTADQLSNLSGGLQKTLQRQLQLWVESRGTGSVPEEVNPHLYEEIIHYAMRNGKMRMEDKMFYVVQGARYGLISIDRIQALAGQNGGVLNQFPMIDYFNGNHNTLPELEAISSRIEEGLGDARFEPGPKTTLWIHTEVLRDDDAKARMSKAMSGGRTEALDHEDIPTLAAVMDYKSVEEITGVLSGSRFKISYEAAKNFYTGPGTKLKILARKAELAQSGGARFTTYDAAEAAKTIATYLHFDNIVTGNANDNKPRIELTLDQISTQNGPSTGGHKVKEYRDPLHALARDALQEAKITWGQGEALKDVTIDEYMRSPAENASNSIIYDKNRKARNFNATGEIERQLKAAFIGDPNLLVKILARHADQLREEIYFNRMGQDNVRSYLESARGHGGSSLAQGA